MGISPVLLGILAATTATTVGTSIYEAVNQPSTPQAPSQSQTATQQAQAAQASALAEAQAISKRRGLASTILQNPTSGGPASIQRATLGA